MRIIFLGTPSFAVTVLDRLLASRHEITAVISQPDRAKNRRGALIFTPVKSRAMAARLPLYQFESIKKEGMEIVASLRPDIMVTAAYGQILNKELLKVPAYGVVNVHASLLPRYRGSSPVQWAILNGEKETGVTIMQTAEGLDTGDILAQKELTIGEDNAEELMKRLAAAGAELLVETLDKIEAGTVRPLAQDEAKATKCRLLKKTDGLINWDETAYVTHNKIRGLYPWPAAYTFFRGKSLKILAATPISGTGKPGEMFFCGHKGLAVVCGLGALKLESLKLEGHTAMSGDEFANGFHIAAGERLNENK